MRPFGALALEMLAIAVPMLRGMVSDTWETDFSRDPRPSQRFCERGTTHHR